MEPIEQDDVLPAASVAVAWNVVVELLVTAAVSPGEAKSAAVPCVTSDPAVHVLVV
jgi:hypothetical protein